jgi:hypothetical protein
MSHEIQQNGPTPDQEHYSSRDYGVTDTFVQYSKRRFRCLFTSAPGASPLPGRPSDASSPFAPKREGASALARSAAQREADGGPP